MTEWLPSNASDLAALLHQAAGGATPVRVEGAGTKRHWGGPPTQGTLLRVTALNRVIEYEPRDLTICLEAGVRLRDLASLLAANRQMLPIDPPYAAEATIGGIVATGLSGPRRRLYGGIRDQVIGMTFATMDGNLVSSGGKVVKNVAGLDMQKALIGSYGTLGVITQVNFKLAPLPESTRTFVLPASSSGEASALRSRILAGVLQPAALDALNAPAARAVGLEAAPCLVLRAVGAERVLTRYSQELPGALTVDGEAEESLWRRIEAFAENHRIVAQACHALPDLAAVLDSAPAEALARGANGVAFLAFQNRAQAAEWLSATRPRPWSRVVLKAPPEDSVDLDLWPDPGPDLELMRRLKATFDPQNLLNKGRLHGRI
jgi:glycolate oxidase FAD binding subunit